MLPVIPKTKFLVKNKFLPKGKIECYPFTTGLESLLLQAKDGTHEEKQQAVRQIIEACTATPNVDFDAIPVFVIEDIFLRIREKSVGEIITMSFLCQNKVRDENIFEKFCGNRMDMKIDLREVKLFEPKDHKNIIMVTDTVGIKFKYLTLGDGNADRSENTDTDYIIDSIDSIFDGDTVYKKAKDEEDTSGVPREEFVKFYSDLELGIKAKIFTTFFATIPHLRHSSKLKCVKCGYEHEYEFNSLNDIFAQF